MSNDLLLTIGLIAIVIFIPLCASLLEKNVKGTSHATDSGSDNKAGSDDLYVCLDITEFPELEKRPGFYDKAIHVARLAGNHTATNAYLVPQSFFKDYKKPLQLHKGYSSEEFEKLGIDPDEAVHAYNGMVFISA